jgi:hypothetical protein
MFESQIARIRKHPFNLLLILATYFGVTFSLTSGTPTIPPVSDFAYYIDMANGLPAPDPFGKRILMPFIVGLLGGSPYVFHYINLALITLSATLLYMTKYNKQSFLSGLLFLACTRAITIYSGEPSPDAMTYFLIGSALFLVNYEYDWLNVVVLTLAAANHPISFVIVGAIIVINNFDKPMKWLYLVPGIVVFIFLIPQSYGLIYYPDIPRLLNVVKSVNILWLGVFTIRKDRDSVLLISIILATLGFSFIASNIDRVLSPLGILLAPRFVSILYPEKEVEESRNPEG